MTTVGFLGLGVMGRPMAMNLLKSGVPLTVASSSPEKLRAFAAAGATAGDSPRALARCAVICLCLPGGAEVTRTVEELLPLLHSGQTVVDFSTIDRSTAIQLAEQCAGAGVDFVDAPVSGMGKRAEEGTLTIMCGGKRAAFDRLLPLLGHMGSKVLYMGESGSGQLAKLINQLLLDINAAAIAEVMPMAVKLGLDPEQITEVVTTGTGSSYAAQCFLPQALRRDFSDGLAMERAYKDLLQAATISAQEKIPMPLLHAATSTYQAALCSGYGGLCKGGMIRVYEDLLGVQFAPAHKPNETEAR